MQTTTNYGLKIYEGSDLFNPLTVENVNTSDLDTIVKGVSNAAVGTATELLTGTVHALTRSDTARNVFHFTATANFEASETFEVDGVQVTAKTPDGQNLSTGAYVINSSVLCILNGTLLTVIVNPAKALDADKLDGHDSTYFATAGDLSVLDNQVGAISNKVGTGVLDVGSNCVDGINTLNTHLSSKADKVWTIAGNAGTVGGAVTVPVTGASEFLLVGALNINGQAEISGSINIPMQFLSQDRSFRIQLGFASEVGQLQIGYNKSESKFFIAQEYYSVGSIFGRAMEVYYR